MKLSLAWLGDYVDLPDDGREVADRLTAAGLAVEEIVDYDGDTLFDVDVTTNRPDCMNHLGLAREVAVLLDQPLRRPSTEPVSVHRGPGQPVEVVIEDREGCPRYVALGVRGVKVGPSPAWLVRRLESVGVRPINNIVDVTNYVLWETGQPLHAFDRKTLRGGKIIVRSGGAGETLVTLDGERRELDVETLVIADADRAIALAGIMGGAATEVTDATVDVLIESAHFDRSRVRRGARRLGLSTDASHRFERGSDPLGCLEAAVRAARLMVELAGGEVVAPAVDECHTDSMGLGRPAELDLERLNRFAGAQIPPADVERWLEGLGFEPERVGGILGVKIPSWRHFDFEPDESGRVEPADLYEEAMRIYGFERIASTLPALGEPDSGSSASYKLRQRVRSLLAAAGLSEAISFSFHAAADSRRWPALASQGKPLALANPISQQYAEMRRSLLTGLVETARYNQRRGADRIRFFELGSVFPGGQAEEVERVALVAGGGSGMPWDREPEFDLFDLKGVVEALAAAFGLALAARPAALSGLIAETSCELFAGGELVGHLGQIDDPALPYPLFAAELRTDLFQAAPAVVQVELPSRHPAIAMDLTLTHSVETSWREISEAVSAEGASDLSEFRLKDRYQGEGVPEGAVNTTIHFLYRAEDRSLTQEEVNRGHGVLSERLRSRFERPVNA